MQSQLVIKKQRLPFTQIPNDLLCNPEISGLAKALWCVLYSKPDDWTFYWREIEKNFKEGRDAIRKAAKQLEDLGYLQKEQKRILTGRGKEWKFGGMEIALFHDPSKPLVEEGYNKGLSPNTENPYPGNEDAGSEDPENPHTYKDLSNKDLSNKDLNYSSYEESEKKEDLNKENEIKEIEKSCTSSKSISEKDKIQLIISYFDLKGYKSCVQTFLLYHKLNIHDTFKKLPYFADKWEHKFEDLTKLSQNNTKEISLSKEEERAWKFTEAKFEYAKKHFKNPDSLTKEELDNIKKDLENEQQDD